MALDGVNTQHHATIGHVLSQKLFYEVFEPYS